MEYAHVKLSKRKCPKGKFAVTNHLGKVIVSPRDLPSALDVALSSSHRVNIAVPTGFFPDKWVSSNANNDPYIMMLIRWKAVDIPAYKALVNTVINHRTKYSTEGTYAEFHVASFEDEMSLRLLTDDIVEYPIRNVRDILRNIACMTE